MKKLILAIALIGGFTLINAQSQLKEATTSLEFNLANPQPEPETYAPEGKARMMVEVELDEEAIAAEKEKLRKQKRNQRIKQVVAIAYVVSMPVAAIIYAVKRGIWMKETYG